MEDHVLSERAEAVLDTAPPQPAVIAATSGEQSDATLAMIQAVLAAEKAEEVVTIPLAGKSEIADHMVIASGRSSRQVAAMAEKLSDQVKARDGASPRIEGKDAGDWVLIDCGDVIVHLFRPEVRAFYQLEKMWAGSPSKA